MALIDSPGPLLLDTDRKMPTENLRNPTPVSWNRHRSNLDFHPNTKSITFLSIALDLLYRSIASPSSPSFCFGWCPTSFQPRPRCTCSFKKLGTNKALTTRDVAMPVQLTSSGDCLFEGLRVAGIVCLFLTFAHSGGLLWNEAVDAKEALLHRLDPDFIVVSPSREALSVYVPLS